MSLEEAIRAGRGEVVAWLRGKDEASRRASAPAVLKLYKSTSGAYQGPEREINRAASVAMMGVATMAELRKARLDLALEQEEVFAVLRDRRPDWLTEWAAFSLERQPHGFRWLFVRRLEDEGLCQRPDGEGYWLGMIQAAGRDGALALVERYPELDLWRLFEVEGAGEFSLAAFDKYTADERGWAHGLRELSRRGLLERSRLLDASLQALGRDFEQFRAGWFSRFHDLLEPSLEERQARVGAYVGLLGSRIGPTVSFALRALNGLAVEVVEPLAPALTAREKGTALAALKLLSASNSPRVALVAAEGLGHAATEVQKAAWKLVSERGTGTDTALRGAVQERVEGVSATLAPTIRTWLGAPSSQSSPAPLPASPREGRQPVIPVADGDELLELLSRLLETGEPALDLERAMDGVSRLCAENPGKAGAPLLKRAEQRLKRPAGRCQTEMARLAVAWLGRRLSPRPEDYQVQLGSFLSARVDELCARVVVGRNAPLAALPAWSDGRVDPAGIQLPADPLDLAQALLRLAPGRGDGPGEGGDALRFATGGTAQVGPTAPLWAAAARARCPHSDCAEVEARHPGLGNACQPGFAIFEEHNHLWVRLTGLSLPEPMLQLPTLLVWASSGDDTPADRRWQATIWPNGRPAWWARGSLALGNNLDWWEADWADVVYLESLLEPVPLEVHGRRLLALGLAAKEAGQSGMAIDALAAALSQGRVDPRELAATFAELNELLKPARWARTLAETARVSEAVAAQVYDLLERHLALAPPAGELVELLVELGAGLERSLVDPLAREALASLKGSGKAARAAKIALSQQVSGLAQNPSVSSKLT